MDCSLTAQIAVLQKQRIEAIKQCDFGKSKAIDVHIKTLQEQEKNDSFVKRKQTAEQEYSLIEEKIKVEIITIQQEMEMAISQKKSEFAQRLVEIHRKHSERVEEMAYHYAANLETETNRVVPEAQALVTSAKLKAKYGEYELAEKILEESKVIHQNSVDKRIEELNLAYQAQQVEMEKRHQEEINNCESKREKKIIEISSKFEDMVSKRYKELRTASLRLGLICSEAENKPSSRPTSRCSTCRSKSSLSIHLN